MTNKDASESIFLQGKNSSIKYYVALICVMLYITVPQSLYSQSTESPSYPLSSSQKGIDVTTDVLEIAMPVAALTGSIIMRDWQGLKQGAFTAVATVGATYILKYSIKKRRPDGTDSHAFPSGHAAVTFATAAFVQRRYGWAYGAPAYALAVFTGWGRIYSKRHDIWDVLAGAAIGAGSAYIFTRPWAREHELSITPVTDGQNMMVTASFTF